MKKISSMGHLFTQKKNDLRPGALLSNRGEHGGLVDSLSGRGRGTPTYCRGRGCLCGLEATTGMLLMSCKCAR